MIRLVLLAAALLVPSRIGVFDGIPLDGGAELALLVLALPLVCSARLRRRADEGLGRRGRPAATAALALVLVAKLTMLAAAPSGGFESCYRSTQWDPLDGARCEVSFANPFRLSGATRIDERLDFGPRDANPAVAGLLGRVWLRDGPLPASDWNLAFVNDLRFNWIASIPRLPDRNRLPFELHTGGPVELERAGRVVVDYVGEGRLKVGGRSVELRAAYERPGRASLPAVAGRQELALLYAFRREAANGDPPGPHYAELALRGPDGELLETAGPGWAWTTAAALAAAILIAASAGLAVLYSVLLRPYRWFAAGVLALLALGALMDSPADVLVSVPPSAPYVLALALLVGALLWRPGPHPMLAGWAGAAAAATVRTLDEFPDYSSVLYPNGGDDPLIYESMAANILATGSLEGQEEVFGFQPGFRYLLFGLRLLLGPTAPPLSILALAALAAGVVFAADRLRPPQSDSVLPPLAAAAAAALMIGVLWSDTQVGHLRALHSEWTTWILLPFGSALLLAGRSPRDELAGALLLGLEAVVRMNQLPLVAAVLALYVLQAPAPRRRAALATAAAGLSLLLLPLAHNVIYAGEWKPFASGASTVNEPGELISVGSDEHRRTRVADQLARAFYLPPARVESDRPDQRVGDLKLYVGGLELLWLAAIAAALVLRRRLGVIGLAGLSLPLAALLPYAFYDPISYYPRHVVIGWLAMGLAVLLVCRDAPRTRRGAA